MKKGQMSKLLNSNFS